MTTIQIEDYSLDCHSQPKTIRSYLQSNARNKKVKKMLQRLEEAERKGSFREPLQVQMEVLDRFWPHVALAASAATRYWISRLRHAT
jgi:hypothetical protein